MSDHPTPLEVLRGARELLSDPARWCKDAYARDEEGEELTDTTGPDACSWCLAGAVEKVLGRDLKKYDEPIVPLLFRQTGKTGDAYRLGALFLWNDEPGRTHADVIQLLDRAIAEAAHA